MIRIKVKKNKLFEEDHASWMKSLLKTLKKEKDPSIINKINEEIKRYFNTSDIDELYNILDEYLNNPSPKTEIPMFWEGLHKINVEVKSIFPDMESIFKTSINNYKKLKSMVLVLNKNSLKIPRDKYLIFSMFCKSIHDISNSWFFKNKNIDKKGKIYLVSLIDSLLPNKSEFYYFLSLLFPKEYFEPRYNFDETKQSNNPKEINPVIALRKKNKTLGYAVLQEIE